jgi:hypothetical protein
VAEQQSADNALAPVTVRNTTRGSLSFRVPGMSLHLLPGQSIEVPAAYLDTDELASLCRQGAIARVKAASAVQPAPQPRPQGQAPVQPATAQPPAQSVVISEVAAVAPAEAGGGTARVEKKSTPGPLK